MGGSGVIRSGHASEGGYTPLYLIKAIMGPPPGRRDDSQHSGERYLTISLRCLASHGVFVRWREVDTPWDELDDDGEEDTDE